MRRGSRKAKRAVKAESPRFRWALLAPILLCAAVLVFYWTPLTSNSATIQWDTVDVHYTAQKYFADRALSGNLPFWTPYIFSGYPFLADPQAGAWYPLNWPFFLIGITPRTVQLELALHSLLASAGAYFLGLRLLGGIAPAVAAGLLFGLSGFFAGHSSHLGIFQTAAWLPWLILAFARAVDSPSVRNVVLAAAAGGFMALAGHFQTALYGFTALALFGAAEIRRTRKWMRVAAILVAVACLAALLSAVQTMPGLELVTRSIRAKMDAGNLADGVLPLNALLTLIFPNALGALSGDYSGPADITQYYFYAGILLLPLAFLGLKNRSILVPAAVLAIPALWYALGPSFGLYRVVALVPGFRSVRAPVHAWFIVALALAVLAGAGVAELLARRPKAYVAPLVLAVVFIDLCYWNCAGNRLAYAQASFDRLYGQPQRRLQQVAAAQPSLTRFMAPELLSPLGPFNAPLEVGLEATYGYSPLKIVEYEEYIQAAAMNPKLIDGLNVSRLLNLKRGAVDVHPSPLPRAYFARSIAWTKGVSESRSVLGALDPGQTTAVEGAPLKLRYDPASSAEVIFHDERSIKVRCRTATDALLRIAIPFYPGWRASVDGAGRPLLRADHAFIGVPVPAGSREVNLQFRSNYFALGAWISVLTGVLMAAAAILAGRAGLPG